ncbi:MAG: TonB-dependent receptor, partial [Acidobacteriia bacterium]|nr:TonB-dependent receptor [Terriglobia bacterium]
FNEYQRTHRATVGLSGRIGVTASSEVTFAGYMRATQWKESVPSSVDHRDIRSPGGFVQYTVRKPLRAMTNTLSVGADLDYQTFNDYRRPNVGGAREGATILSDQDIRQRGLGVHLLDRLELSPQWSLMAGLRNDSIDNRLDDNLAMPALDHSGRKSFSKTTARVGIAWNGGQGFGAYASWAQGFLPPATEGLAANPDGFGGFNQHLVPTTSRGEEVGVRGAVANTFTYDVAVFHLLTDNDFGRYRVASRPLETFYYNAGSSRRFGVEALLGYYPTPRFSMELAYTYSHFIYDQVSYNGATYRDTRLPSSPDHQATLDTEYRFTPRLMVGVSAEMWTRAYVDPSNVAMDPSSVAWVGGYTLIGARVAYKTRVAGVETELLLSGRNLGGKRYIAFAEPDPDGNSYHPGPERELFAGATVRF